MKYLSGFTVSEGNTNTVFEFDEIAFQLEMDSSERIGYELNQVFVDGKIVNYYSSVVEFTDKEKEFVLAKIDYVKGLYGVEPTYCVTDNKTYHLVFLYSKVQNTSEHNRIKNILNFIYGGEVINYHFYNYGDKIFNIYKSRNKKVSTKKIFNYYLITQEHNYSFDTDDLAEYIKVNQLEISKVVEKIHEFNRDILQRDLEKIDVTNNVHILLGKPFEYVYKIFGSPLKTKEFFNNNFGTEFNLEEEISIDAMNGGTLIQNISGDIYLNEKGYAKNTTNDTKQLTDFHIEVNYIIHDLDGTKTYIITLTNTIKGTKTPKIKLETKVNAASFSEFVQSYGNYHFYGTTSDIKEIHASISSVPGIPEIKQLIGFGEHKEEGIIIFKNGIWSLEEQMFYDREDDEEYFEGPNNNGYYVVDVLGKGLLYSLDRNVPIFNKDEKLNKNDIYNAFEGLYADNTGHLLLYTLFGMIGHLLHGNKESTFPLIFTRGVTGSGKSKMNSILQTAFGLKNSSNDFGNTSVFSFNYALSYLIKFPYFITEYREGADNRKTKVGTLRAIFDKTGQTKGRADQSIVKYDYYGVPVIDGEEMIIDGALRTRSNQTQLIKKHLIKGNFEALLEDNEHIFKNIMYTYFLESNGEKYNDYIKHFIDFAFKEGWTNDSRIAKNIAQLYAGAMCFDKSLDEQLKVVLSEMTIFQQKDKDANSTSMQIIKVLVKFLESNPFNGVYPRRDKLIISWDALTNFINRFNVETTLDSGSYTEHLEGLGYEVGLEDVGDRMVNGVIIPYEDIPKYFLTHTEVYAAYNDWKKQQSV